MRSRARTFFSVVLLALGAVFTVAAESASPVRFDVPAGEASATLKQFSEQSGQTVVYLVDTVRGVKTGAVKGQFTARDALNRMLAGTELVLVQDEKSGALTVNRLTAEEKNAASRLAEAQTAERLDAEAAARTRVQGGVVELESYAVTGSRIRSLVGEQGAQPVFTLNREEIERTGATNFGDLFRYIPAVTSSTTGAFTETGPGQVGSSSWFQGASANLHGFPDGSNTLILIDGRRVPKSNILGSGGSFTRYEVNGLTIAAIERIEVLLDGASAIYGADAVAGVINVITRKNYSGTELHVSYNNVFDSDAAQRSVNLTHGFARDKWSIMLTLSAKDETALSLRDTDTINSLDRRIWGGTDARGNVVTDGAGYVRTTNGANLPGLSSSRAAIPAGSNGNNLTIADFANAGPIGEPHDFYRYFTRPTNTELSGRLKLDYRFRNWLRAYGELAASNTKTSGENGLSMNTGNTGVTVPAGYPGNPFGVPIIVNKVFWDLPRIQGEAITDTTTAVAGINGDLGRGWRYDASVTMNRTEKDTAASSTSLHTATLNAAIASTNRPILIYDSQRASPNTPGTLEALRSLTAEQNEIVTYWTYAVQADGPIWTLPSGEVRIAVGAEMREEYLDTMTTSFAVGTTTAPLQLTQFNRTTTGTFAEMRLPVISDRQQWRWLRRADLSLAIRRDSYSDEEGATTPSASILLQPFKWLTLRSSYSEGYRVAEMRTRFRLPSSSNVPTNTTIRDPLRGNQLIPGPYTSTLIANPDLRPESSKSWTHGIVFEVPFVKNLSFSANYWHTDYIDRFGSPYTVEEMIVLFPEQFIRGPNLPGDQAGWPGPIREIISFTRNIAVAELAGWDASVRYSRTTPWGEFTVRGDYSKNTRNNIYARPDRPPTTASGTYNLPAQLTGSVFFKKGPIDTGFLVNYRDSWASTSSATPSTAYASAVRWDWQGSYDFDQAPWVQKTERRWLRAALKGTQLAVGIFNCFDSEPNPSEGTLRGVFDYSLYPSYRVQQYTLQLKKRF